MIGIRERKAFGAPLLDNQYIHFRLAELLTEVEMLRYKVVRSGAEVESGENRNIFKSAVMKKKNGLSKF